jgi:hypothetical protein
MDDREQPSEESERPRPRVVDKRVSARPETAGETASERRESRAATAPPDQAPERLQDPSRAAEPAPAVAAPPPTPPPQPPPAESAGGTGQVWTPEQEEQARRIAEELARVPARDLIVTFAMNFVEVASVKLESGDLAGAQLAIDAFEGVLKGLGGNLGEAESPMRTVLAELQMAYAQRAMRPPNVGS